MKPTNRPHFQPIFAALMTIAGSALASEVPPAHDHDATQHRHVTHDASSHAVVLMQTGADNDGEDNAFSAQAAPGNINRHIEIMRHGDFGPMPDIDAIVSTAMSEAFSGMPRMPGRAVIKNAPYSAEVIAEKIQLLPDGNQISKRSSSTAFRDSAGRTRQEVRDAKGELRSVQINDAVEGTRYVLSPSRKSATKFSIDKALAGKIEAAREKARTMRKDGEAVVIERAGGGPGEDVIVKRIELPAEGGRKEVREEVRVNVIRGDRAGGNVSPPGFEGMHGPMSYSFSGGMHGAPMAFSFQDMKWSSKATSKDLGPRDFDGVRADGKSRSYTIPAGEIGNKNPITVVTETWYSPELQLTVYSKQSDPRVGDTIYRLANIKRNEQPMALFSVPADYTVKDMPRVSVDAKVGR